MEPCVVCGRRDEDDDWQYMCGECAALGFGLVMKGDTVIVICPTCGEDFKECGCSAPDSAIM